MNTGTQSQPNTVSRESWRMIPVRQAALPAQSAPTTGPRQEAGVQPSPETRGGASDAEAFLQALSRLAQVGEIDAALRIVFRWCDTHFRRSTFARVGEALTLVDATAFPGDLLVGLMAATFPATTQLGVSRVQFLEKARRQLTIEFGTERAQGIFARLT